MASTQEVEMLRRQLDELTAQMIESRQKSSNTAMNAAVTGLAETENDGTVGVETAPRGHGSQSRTHLAKTLTTGILLSTGTRVRSILPILPC